MTAEAESLVVHDAGGAGPVLALVHGFSGSSRDFAEVAPQLTGMRRVVLIDQLGHGDSPRRDHYTYDVLTTAVIAAIESLGAPVDLLGHSLGGRVVLPIAWRRPDLVRSIVVMDGWADQPDRGEPGRVLAQRIADGADMDLALAEFDESRHDLEAQLIVATRGEAWHEARLAANAAGFDEAAYTQLAPAVFISGDDALARCGDIQCPTTVIVGEFDTPFLGPSERIARRIPQAELVTIAGAFHSPQLTHPKEWLAAVRHHLHRVDHLEA